jgi:hypothetical protein
LIISSHWFNRCWIKATDVEEYSLPFREIATADSAAVELPDERVFAELDVESVDVVIDLWRFSSSIGVDEAVSVSVVDGDDFRLDVDEEADDDNEPICGSIFTPYMALQFAAATRVKCLSI